MKTYVVVCPNVQWFKDHFKEHSKKVGGPGVWTYTGGRFKSEKAQYVYCSNVEIVLGLRDFEVLDWGPLPDFMSPDDWIFLQHRAINS